jgi:hypothetical protein
MLCIHFLNFRLVSLFWKTKRRLMRSPCHLCVRSGQINCCWPSPAVIHGSWSHVTHDHTLPCLCVCIILCLCNSGLTTEKTLSSTAGCLVFYVVCIMLKESRWSIFPRTSYNSGTICQISQHPAAWVWCRLKPLSLSWTRLLCLNTCSVHGLLSCRCWHYIMETSVSQGLYLVSDLWIKVFHLFVHMFDTTIVMYIRITGLHQHICVYYVEKSTVAEHKINLGRCIRQDTVLWRHQGSKRDLAPFQQHEQGRWFLPVYVMEASHLLPQGTKQASLLGQGMHLHMTWLSSVLNLPL